MRYVAISVMIVCAALPPLLTAQEATARLLGTVTDPTGAVIPTATIVAKNVATGLERRTTANESGDYSIPMLPIGQYTVTAESTGFKTSTVTGLTLQLNQEARLDIKLALGTAAESIEVQAITPVLVTDSSVVGQVIENVAIANMPLNGRAFWQLAQLTPGAVYTPGGSDITAGGTGIRANRINLRLSGNGRLNGGWFLDGFDITEYELGSTSITPSTDALEEFKVLAGGMSAEYGLPSIINAVLKSGSNSFHGSAYEYLRNEKIQARNFFSPTVPPLKRNQFGTTFGGPIKHDKIFFFGDYEGARTRQGTTFNSNVPSLQQLDGNFSAGRAIFDPLTTRVNPANSSQFMRDQFPGNIIPTSRRSPQALYFKSWFPTPNNGPGLYAYSPALSLNTDKFDIKVSPRLDGQRQHRHPLLVCEQHGERSTGLARAGHLSLEQPCAERRFELPAHLLANGYGRSGLQLLSDVLLFLELERHQWKRHAQSGGHHRIRWRIEPATRRSESCVVGLHHGPGKLR